MLHWHAHNRHAHTRLCEVVEAGNLHIALDDKLRDMVGAVDVSFTELDADIQEKVCQRGSDRKGGEELISALR